MKRVPFKVTDHAALRYLERVKGVNVKQIKAEVASCVHAAADHPSATAVVVDGFRYVIDQGTVITILPKSRPVPNRAVGK